MAQGLEAPALDVGSSLATQRVVDSPKKVWPAGTYSTPFVFDD
jgi:hypothetical protein